MELPANPENTKEFILQLTDDMSWKEILKKVEEKGVHPITEKDIKEIEAVIKLRKLAKENHSEILGTD